MMKRVLLSLFLLFGLLPGGASAQLCVESVSPTEVTASPDGELINISVTFSDPRCTYLAFTDERWLSLPGGGAYTGVDTVEIEASPNDTGKERTGVVTFTDLPRGNLLVVTITQSAGGDLCVYAVDPVSAEDVSPAGANLEFSLTVTGSPCFWDAVASDSWLSLPGTTFGAGDETVTIDVVVAPNDTDQPRTGTISVGDQTFTVNQLAGCASGIEPTTAAFDSAGGDGSFDVFADLGCEWLPTTAENWILVGGRVSSGNGTATFTVLENTGGLRAGTIFVGARQFFVVQRGVGETADCALQLTPEVQSFGSNGGNGTFSMEASLSCVTSIVSNERWITIESPSPSDVVLGSQVINYNVEANGGKERSGTITAGGLTFTVNQAASGATCVTSVAPDTVTASWPSQSVSVFVDAPVDCDWEVFINDPWVSIDSGATGTGPGEVVFVLGENDGPFRTASADVGGIFVTIAQDAARGEGNCIESFAPPEFAIPAEGGNFSLFVDTFDNECSYLFKPDADWLSPDSGDLFFGDETIFFTVDPNFGPARAAIVDIGGYVLPIRQKEADGFGCALGFDPDSAGFSSAGGDSFANLFADPDCIWIAESDSPWLTITSGLTGQGDGEIGYSVAANGEGPGRVGTITAGAVQHFVYQGAAAGFRDCVVAATPDTMYVPREGATTLSVDITTSGSCVWVAETLDSWIHLSRNSFGSGDGSFTFDVEPNIDSSARIGFIDVDGITIRVLQEESEGFGCAFDLQPTEASFGPEAASGQFIVQYNSEGCLAVPISNDPWLLITQVELSSEGFDTSLTVSYLVEENLEADRFGTIDAGGLVHTVTQTGIPRCVESIDPTENFFGPNGGSASIAVTADRTCEWGAIASDRWISIDDGGPGNGSGDVLYSVEFNDTGKERTGTIDIGGLLHTITQSGASGCPSSIDPVVTVAGTDGGSFLVSVNADSECGWTATTNDRWIQFDGDPSGSGSGEFSFTVDANGGPARIGTILVNDFVHTVFQSQSSGFECVSIDPLYGAFSAGGGELTVIVSADKECVYAVTPDSPWVSLVEAQPFYAGFAALTYIVEPNKGASRAASIDIGGVIHTVVQDAAPGFECVESVEPATAYFVAEGGTGQFTAFADSKFECYYTVQIQDPWVTLTNPVEPIGFGTASFEYEVAPNDGAARMTTVTIGGVPHLIVQAEAEGFGCVDAIEPTESFFDIAGGIGAFDVTATTECLWLAQTPANFIVIDEPRHGFGDGIVTFTVLENSGEPRSTVITVGGQTHLITQDGTKATPTPTETPTPTQSPTPTESETPTPTATETPTPTETAVPTPTDAPTATPSPTETETPTPTQTATPEPTASATPTPTPTASPTLTASPTVSPSPTATPVFFDFGSDPQGWAFYPFFTMTDENGFPNPGVPGTLDIRSADSTNSFGFWESPAFTLATGGSENYFVSRYRVLSDQTDASLVPTIRIRTTTEDASQSDLVAIESTGDGANSPTASQAKEYELYFRLAAGNPSLRFQFDLLNFDNFGAPNGTIRLDNVSVEPVSPSIFAGARSERVWTFEDGADRWVFNVPPADQFVQPRNIIPDGRLLIQAVPFSPEGPQAQFGWWNGPELSENGGVTIEPNRRYFALFTVDSSLGSPNDVPSFRLRLNETQYQVAQLTQVASNYAPPATSAANVPTAGNPRTYVVFFPANAANGRNLFPSFDLLTTAADLDSTSAIIGLLQCEIRSVPVN